MGERERETERERGGGRRRMRIRDVTVQPYHTKYKPYIILSKEISSTKKPFIFHFFLSKKIGEHLKRNIDNELIAKNVEVIFMNFKAT